MPADQEIEIMNPAHGFEVLQKWGSQVGNSRHLLCANKWELTNIDPARVFRVWDIVGVVLPFSHTQWSFHGIARESDLSLLSPGVLLIHDTTLGICTPKKLHPKKTMEKVLFRTQVLGFYWLCWLGESSSCSQSITWFYNSHIVFLSKFSVSVAMIWVILPLPY